jgi:hypothetical protein
VQTNGTLTFPAGSTSQNVSITVNGDMAPEFNELIQINLSNPSGATLAFNIGFGTIIDDDSPISFSVDSTFELEGNAGITNMVFTVHLSRPSGSPTSVDYQTHPTGTAVLGVDYNAVPLTTLNIPANATSATFTVPILTDLTPEPDETVNVSISNPVGGVLLVANAAGTIVDDDGPPSVSVTSEHITEGCDGATTATFDVVLSRASVNPVTVNFSTANGTATGGSDYVATSGTVTFAPGQTTRQIVVTVNGDALVEPDETFQVNLTGAAGATISIPSGTGTILNDD